MDRESGRVRPWVERAFDVLQAYQWWIAAVLSLGVVIWADPADPHRWTTWLLFGLCLVLLWVPLGVRIARGARRTVEAFKEGLDGR